MLLVLGVTYLEIRAGLDPAAADAWMARIPLILIGIGGVTVANLFALWPILTLPRIADLIAATGRCAACGYDIASIAPDEGGLSVCPECGGAWRVHQDAGHT